MSQNVGLNICKTCQVNYSVQHKQGGRKRIKFMFNTVQIQKYDRRTRAENLSGPQK